MGRDTGKIEEDTNVKEEPVHTQIITENQLINLKLDKILAILVGTEEVKEQPSEENSN